MFRVANNTLISISRRIGNQPSDNAPQKEVAYSDEDHHDIADLIGQLDEPDRTIVQSYLYGFKHSETAKIVGMSTGAVSVRLSRIVRKLRKMYEQ